MRISRNKHRIYRFGILFVALGIMATLPLLSSARSSAPVTNSVNIVNNSNRTIRYVYFSHVNAEDWTGNQLAGNGISPGGSATVSNFSCDQQQVKVIGEDADGCFVSAVVSCGSSTWTITNDTAADCGQ